MILESALFLLLQLPVIGQPQEMRRIERFYAVSIQQEIDIEFETLTVDPPLEWLDCSRSPSPITENYKTSRLSTAPKWTV